MIFLCVLTARPFADDSMRAIPARTRLPEATVALDPEAGVWRQNRESNVMRLPVGVRHLYFLAPHQTSACGWHTSIADIQ